MHISYQDKREESKVRSGYVSPVELGHGTARLSGYRRLAVEVDTDLAFNVEIDISPSELQMLWKHYQDGLQTDREKAEKREAQRIKAQALPEDWHFKTSGSEVFGSEDDRSLMTLPLSIRVRRILEREGIKTLGRLKRLNSKSLRDLNGFGSITEIELLDSLKEAGIDIVVDKVKEASV